MRADGFNRTEHDLTQLAEDFHEGRVKPETLPARLEYIAAFCRQAIEAEKAINRKPNAFQEACEASLRARKRLHEAGVPEIEGYSPTLAPDVS